MTAARIGALILGTIAVGCMTVAIAGMVTGRPSDRMGWLLRAVAVTCFVGCVVLATIAHH